MTEPKIDWPAAAALITAIVAFAGIASDYVRRRYPTQRRDEAAELRLELAKRDARWHALSRRVKRLEKRRGNQCDD